MDHRGVDGITSEPVVALDFDGNRSLGCRPEAGRCRAEVTPLCTYKTDRQMRDK